MTGAGVGTTTGVFTGARVCTGAGVCTGTFTGTGVNDEELVVVCVGVVGVGVVACTFEELVFVVALVSILVPDVDVSAVATTDVSVGSTGDALYPGTMISWSSSIIG